MAWSTSSSLGQQLCLCLIATTPEANTRIATRELHRANLFELRIDYLAKSLQSLFLDESQKALISLNNTWGNESTPMARRQGFSQVPGFELLLSHIDQLLALGKPLILTARTNSDGGTWPGEWEGLRLQVLKALFWVYGQDSRCLFDFEFDSYELSAFVSHPLVAMESKARIIRSFHWFDENWDYAKAYQKLDQLVRSCHHPSSGYTRWIPKAALGCGSIGQLRDLFLLAKEFNPTKQDPFLLLGMGEWGMATRIIPAWLGSLWSYSTPGEPGDLPAAPGQLDPDTLDQVYGFSRLDGSQRVFAILGNPVAHSKSPGYHNQEFVKKAIPGVYIPLRADSLEDAMDLAELIPLEGMSVTIPHKEAVISYLTSWDPGVVASGACNTLVRGPCGWFGSNTDIPGFLAPLETGDLGNPDQVFNRVLVVGAGGAARAIVYGIAGKTHHLTLVNRTPERARTLLEEMKDYLPSHVSTQVLSLEEPIVDNFDLIIQTTSLGMDDLSDPLPGYNFQGTEVVYDIIYTPDKTPILTRAEAAGCKVVNGWPMFLKQAELQNLMFAGHGYRFRYFDGQDGCEEQPDS